MKKFKKSSVFIFAAVISYAALLVVGLAGNFHPLVIGTIMLSAVVASIFGLAELNKEAETKT